MTRDVQATPSTESYSQTLDTDFKHGLIRYAQQSRAYPSRTITASATLAQTDFIVNVSTAGGAVTVTLPKIGLCTNKIYVIRKTNSAGSNLTIQGNGENIDGAASIVHNVQYRVYWLAPDFTASQWSVVGYKA